MIRLATPLLALALLLGSGMHDASAQQAIQEYEYAPNRIYPVRTGLGITTQIELSPDEVVVDYSTGFSSGWELTRRENVFYLKPKNVDVDTNLVVRTETHSYIFELRVVATDWKALDQAKQAGVQYKISFRYPNDTKFKAKADEAPKLSTTLEPGRPYHFAYDYATRTKNRWLVPVSVHDDGQFTYIRLNDMTAFPSGNFPAVFGRDRLRGEDFVLNTTVENDTLIVHGTYPYLVIRHGKEIVGLRRKPAQ
ncbi:TrbG/VirB9 family P-type conjugative transfer protein [Lysobacter humi (ex Lee et al. 2017)]